MTMEKRALLAPDYLIQPRLSNALCGTLKTPAILSKLLINSIMTTLAAYSCVHAILQKVEKILAQFYDLK